MNARHAKKIEVEDELQKDPVAPGALTEALSGAAGVAFLGSAYILLFSEKHRFQVIPHDAPYLERLAEVSATQLLAMVLLAASFVVLLGCAGMTFALEDSDFPRLSRLDAYCVVGLLAQGIHLVWLVGVRVWNIFTVEGDPHRAWNGLLWGISFAGFGQVLVLLYHYCRRELGWFRFGKGFIQSDRPPENKASFREQTIRHLFQPSSLTLMVAYLVGTWKLSLMPDSYYNEEAQVNWFHVLLQLLVVDVFTFMNHMAEHSLSSLYISSHKPHHRYITPTLFDAFDGSFLDTVFLILFPLFATCRLLNMVNAWSYIAFGFVYSVHFMLIHSEWENFGDSMASKFGIYVAKDHHVHHARFIYNYAHFFTFWDRALGTYRETV